MTTWANALPGIGRDTFSGLIEVGSNSNNELQSVQLAMEGDPPVFETITTGTYSGNHQRTIHVKAGGTLTWVEGRVILNLEGAKQLLDQLGPAIESVEVELSTPDAGG